MKATLFRTPIQNRPVLRGQVTGPHPPFTDSVDETKVLLAKEMDQQGIHIEVAKL